MSKMNEEKEKYDILIEKERIYVEKLQKLKEDTLKSNKDKERDQLLEAEENLMLKVENFCKTGAVEKRQEIISIVNIPCGVNQNVNN